MTLQQLRYFLAACEHGSFTAAAGALSIAQPSVAEQIRRLEREVGVRLFVRSGRRLTLTESGAELRSHAQRVLSAMQEAEEWARGARELAGSTASLGTFGVAYKYLVKEVVQAFVARFPDVSVRVVGRHTSEVVEAIRRGELEAGLIALPIDESGLHVEPVTSDEVLYAGPAGMDVALPMTIERLSRTRLIAYEAMSGSRDSIRRQLLDQARSAGVVLEATIEVERLESALELVSAGLGGTYVARRVALSADMPPDVPVVSFEPPIYDTFAFVWRRGHEPSPATRELLLLTRTHMESFGHPVASARESHASPSPAEGNCV
jgi:DNA-binding transcriptional LysR family regulator